MLALRTGFLARRWGLGAVMSALCVGLVSGAAPAGAAPEPGITTRVSVASDGTEGNGVSWLDSSISGDGRLVAFSSRASNLVPGDTNDTFDVFVHDRATGETTLVSKSSAGVQGDDVSEKPAISRDGRYVAFRTNATNLDDSVLGGPGIYVHDLQTGETTLASKASDGTPGFGDSPDISADGRYVAFSSIGFGVMLPGPGTRRDVYVHDRVTGVTRRVSVGMGETEPDSFSEAPNIGDDGTVVAFWSRASNLVTGDTNGRDDVFVHDLTSGTTTRVSVAGDGTEGNGASQGSNVSGDGRYVAFFSSAFNLVPGDTNGIIDVFVHDRATGSTTRVSVATDGTEANDFSFSPALSADGRYVAFESQAENLTTVAGGENSEDVFLHDRATGVTTPVSLAADGRLGYGDDPEISADGRHVLFWSFGGNLVADDTNGVEDFFVRDLQADQSLFIADATTLEGNKGLTPLAFTVSLSPASPFRVTVRFATANGTAVTKLDYTATSGRLTFAPGETTKTIVVSVKGDRVREPDESFFVDLSTPTGATLAGGRAVGTIRNDD